MLKILVLGAICISALTSGCGVLSSVERSQPLRQGSSIVAVPMTTATPTTVVACEGCIVGLDGQFSPADGDSPAGGGGQPVDGIPCSAGMSGKYHIHVWIGLYVNGVQYAMPDAIGMLGPSPENSFGVTNNANCFYFLHTHDASGLVHVESPNPTGAPLTASIYTLKPFLDVWGISVSASQFGPFTGPVSVYTSGQVYRGSPNWAGSAATYTRWAADPNMIPLYSREVIIFEVGPSYPPQLPNIHFPYKY